MKQEFEIITAIGERIFTLPGNRGENDMKIYTEFPKMPWAHSIRYVAEVLRLKGIVEQRNYPPDNGFYGSGFLTGFIVEAITNPNVKMEYLLKKYKMPEKE